MTTAAQTTPAWRTCATDAHATLDRMTQLTGGDSKRIEIVSRLALDLSYLCTLGDANGICSLFDSIDFEYNSAGALVSWDHH